MIYLLLFICVCLIIGIAVMVFVVDSEKKKAEEAKQLELSTRNALEPLRKYSKIRNVEKAEKKIIEKSILIQEEIAERTRKIKEYKESLERSVEAMRNAMEGYGDEYILPIDSILDELAEDFSHKNAGVKLKDARKNSRLIVKEQRAATASIDAPHESIVLALDAFNSKVDDILGGARSIENYGKLRQQIKDEYAIINQLGEKVWNVCISSEYLESRLLELKWAKSAYALQLKDREEQKAFREVEREEQKAMREAEKIIKEAEKARKLAEKEEQFLEQAMAEARKLYETASEADREKYEQRFQELEKQKEEAIRQKIEAEENNKRALSLAQQTKQGNIYVISNIGSFGEGVYKIGMTRRYEPMDRVKELGDASVPFTFDVHALVQCDDAPKLEKELHHAFHNKRVNQVNNRKEFFRVNLSDIRKILESKHNKHVTWTMKSEAAEYRETLAKIKLQSAEKNTINEANILEPQNYDL